MDSTQSKAEIEKDFRSSLSRARLMMNKNLLSKDELHKLYGYFQQATQGNCNDWKVFRNMNLVDLESKGKFNAWIALRGMSKTEAMHKYAEEVSRLLAKNKLELPAEGSSSGFFKESLRKASSVSTFPSDPDLKDKGGAESPVSENGAKLEDK